LLIDLSRAVLRVRDENVTGVWPRASALLARQAVEAAIADVLATRAPGAERSPARARLLCLVEYVPTPLARQTAFVWGTLSRVCHHHPYELAPTGEELHGWIDAAEVAVERLEELAQPAGATSGVEGPDQERD
jgi:hypothetical protein